MVGRGQVHLTHFQHRDDTWSFCEDRDENVMAWWSILQLYLQGSGLNLYAENYFGWQQH